MSNIVLKEKTKEEFLEILRTEESGGSISFAATKCGISRQTVYNWRAEDYYFEDAIITSIKEGKERIADLAERALVKRINDGDTTAIIFTLKTLRNNHYGEYEERRKSEQRLAQKPSGMGNPKSAEEAIMLLEMLVWHARSNAEMSKVLTPETTELFDEVKNLIKVKKDMLVST